MSDLISEIKDLIALGVDPTVAANTVYAERARRAQEMSTTYYCEGCFAEARDGSIVRNGLPTGIDHQHKWVVKESDTSSSKGISGSSKRINSEIPRPSAANEETVKPKRLDGSITCHVTILDSLLKMYEKPDEWALQAAQVLLEECNICKHHTCGVGSVECQEKEISALFSSIVQFYCPKTLVDLSPAVLWEHQYGNRDVMVLSRLSDIRNKGYVPRAVFEFGILNPLKIHQLFSYVHNNYVYMLDHIVSLGVIVNISATSDGLSTSGDIIFHGYYECDGKLAEVWLGSGSWSVEYLAKVLHTVYEFTRRPHTDFYKVEDNHMSNVHVDAKTGYVTKLFDGRYRLVESQRRWEHYSLLNANINVLERNLVVVKYVLIEGTHSPTSTEQVVSCLVEARVMKEKDLIHCDIRASNIVFSDQGSKFIDLDYCCKSCYAKYPSNFNLDINDGKRHPDVKPGGPAKFQHDWFALAAVMRRSAPVDDAHSQQWTQAIGLVEEGKLQDAVDLLQKLHFSLKLVDGVADMYVQTGSPHKQKQQTDEEHHDRLIEAANMQKSSSSSSSSSSARNKLATGDATSAIVGKRKSRSGGSSEVEPKKLRMSVVFRGVSGENDGVESDDITERASSSAASGAGDASGSSSSSSRR